MKEKLNKAKGWIKENKKRMAVILTAFLLVIGVGAACIAGVNSVNRTEAENKKTEERKTASEDAKKKVEKKQTEQGKKYQEEKTDNKEEEEDNAEEQKTTADANDIAATQASDTSTSNAGAGTTGNAGSSEGGSGQAYIPPAEPVHSDPPVEQPPAHTHSFTIPVQEWQDKYKQEERSICNTCGADITGNTTAHGKETRHDGYHSEWVKVPDGQELVTVGWKCSCGVAQ